MSNNQIIMRTKKKKIKRRMTKKKTIKRRMIKKKMMIITKMIVSLIE